MSGLWCPGLELIRGTHAVAQEALADAGQKRTSTPGSDATLADLCDRGLWTEQGIDLRAGGRNTKHKHRTEAKTENVYVRLLVKVRGV